MGPSCKFNVPLTDDPQATCYHTACAVHHFIWQVMSIGAVDALTFISDWRRTESERVKLMAFKHERQASAAAYASGSASHHNL